MEVRKPVIVLPEVGLADDSRPFPMAELCLENGLCPPMAEIKLETFLGRQDSQNYDIQHNDTQHNDTLHNDT